MRRRIMTHRTSYMRLVGSLTVLILFVAIVVAIVACAPAFASETETHDDTFSVGATPKIVVSNDNGQIDVVTGNEGTVNVKATIRRPDDVEYSVVQEGDTVRVEAQVSSGWRFGVDSGADITVTLPADTNVDLQTSNGGIEVVGLQNSGKLRTSNGMISLKDVKGEFEVNAMNGAIDFRGEMTAGGMNQLTTFNGSVEVTLLGEPSVKLDATTSNGEITCKLPIVAMESEVNRLVGVVGGGDAGLVIKTLNGSITVQ
jgi:putative adhesin